MLIGKVLLKRYQIVEEIGSGGFGHTYKAIDTAFPGKPHCVVKHLSPHNDDSRALEIAKRLFETEATVLSRLGEHDQIPRLFSYFEEDGEFYLVQELIKGHTLSREFQSGRRWSEEETVDFLRELLEILSVVHQENTIHRDLKPANIMRREDDGKLVLIDFGAVKEILTVDRDGQTDSTVGIGSLTYMPLEQARGRPGKYSDVYTVGMLGVQALTGLASSDLPHDPQRFREILIEEQIEISSELESVLCTMISYQPTDRFADATEALYALPFPEPESPEPTPPSEPTPEPISSPQPLEPTVPINRANFPKKLLLGVLGATALIGAAGVYAFKSLDQPNYARLETYLQNQEWEQANTETDQLILEVAGENSALDAESSNNLSCKAL
ncbi:MAG: protein kinase, partial [Pleurocapsa sp. MO_226.B13]|nr:protein kinase [Pleurocapsa sp. MO_226.B13]